MSDEKRNWAFRNFASAQNKNPTFTPDWGPHPAGTRETVTFSIGGKEVDKIKGTWQEDGTILLDRPLDGGKLAQHMLGGFFIEEVRIRDRSQGKLPERRERQNDAAERHQRQCERMLERGDYAFSRRQALCLARAGEDFVPYRYYRKHSRVLVRRCLLEDDFDGAYERICLHLGEAPVVVLEEEDFVHFREKTGK